MPSLYFVLIFPFAYKKACFAQPGRCGLVWPVSAWRRVQAWRQCLHVRVCCGLFFCQKRRWGPVKQKIRVWKWICFVACHVFLEIKAITNLLIFWLLTDGKTLIYVTRWLIFVLYVFFPLKWGNCCGISGSAEWLWCLKLAFRERGFCYVFLAPCNQ